MYNITSNLVWICPVISLVCLIILTGINVYKLIRRNFSIKVNCWFCNQWTKVPYNNQNSFECPSCLQYNGFNSDGDYNRTLPAQYDVGLNKTVEVSQNQNKTVTSNGLCRICNNNQQLRVFQLANFIPLNEQNFDVEIEHFEKQLDKAYKLCEKCENIVKKTIQKQNVRLGIKISRLGQKGISFMDLTTSSNGISKRTKRSLLKNVLFYTIIFFACLNVTHLLTQLEFFNLSEIIPKQVSVYYTHLQNVYSSITNRFHNLWNHFLCNAGFTSPMHVLETHISTLLNSGFVKDFFAVTEVTCIELLHYFNYLISLLSFNISTGSSVLLYFVGTLLQLIWLFVNGTSFKKNIILLLVWIQLLCSEIGNFKFLNGYLDRLQIGSTALIICLMLLKNQPKKIRMKKKRIQTKVQKHEVIGDVSDEDVVDCFNTESSVPFKMDTVKPVFDYNSSQRKTQKHFCDNTTATEKSYSSLSTKRNNNIDLDVSLNKLHIGPQAAKKTIFKTPLVNPNQARPKPVLSPAKLQNISPTSLSKNSGFNQCNCIEPNRFATQSPNSFFDSLGCQSLFPESMFNLQSTSMFGKHISLCCPRFPYENNLNYNTAFRPLLNNEQLVYLTPNFVQSSNVYEIFPSQSLSTNTFDTYNDKLMNRNGDFNFQKLSNLLESESLHKK
ncbi:hypothetical protein RN001_012558 [Aquatica leii]|uniref:Ima1 N-terminal domain-containing protein n=1 Tax=Aquatica leii TaxID=1421715 RepID=A0AAN7S7U3_9COLE|nr:hypothetical protein RN001_012558 [Aquatica leii]